MPFSEDTIDFGTIKEVRARSSECGLYQLVLDPRVQVKKKQSDYQGYPPLEVSDDWSLFLTVRGAREMERDGERFGKLYERFTPRVAKLYVLVVQSGDEGEITLSAARWKARNCLRFIELLEHPALP